MTHDTVKVINAIQEIRQDDIIIAFLGPTGVGKSHFIDLLTNQIGKRSGNSLKSVTTGIQATRVKHPITGADNIVFLDTPGFDDTRKTDLEILTSIGTWLEDTYNQNVKLSGLVYLHRIIDRGMYGSLYKNLTMFGHLCGDSAAARAVLVSTMWERLQKKGEGEGRETELKEKYWKPLIEKGSRVDRLERSDSKEAWRIIDNLIKTHQNRETLLLQEELVDLHCKLSETRAGKTLYTELQRQLAGQKDALKSLLAQIEKSDNEDLKRVLEKEYNKIKNKFEKTFDEVEKLKVPLSRRIVTFFFGKKTHAGAIKIRGGQ